VEEIGTKSAEIERVLLATMLAQHKTKCLFCLATYMAAGQLWPETMYCIFLTTTFYSCSFRPEGLACRATIIFIPSKWYSVQ